MATLAFDVYGTLIDTQAIVVRLRQFLGDKAEEFAFSWREKQLEYAFRRGLMKCYEDFAVCTRDALDYTCLRYEISLNRQQKSRLLVDYGSLPAFDDVATGLAQLQSAGHRMFAFSNGCRSTVGALLQSAGIREYFIDVISVDDLQSFKPDPAVYHHFLEKTESPSDDTWLISSNSFDVIGALSAGILSAWVRRSSKIFFDPWGIDPTITVADIRELVEHINIQS